MRQLILFRHGQSESSLKDPEQPLTEQGKVEIERAGRFLALQPHLTFQKVLHSPKLRTLQTAEILAGSLKIPLEEREELNPKASAMSFLRLIYGAPENTIAVGHLPQLHEVIQSLLHLSENIPLQISPGAALCFSEVEGTWHLSWMFQPDLLNLSFGLSSSNSEEVAQ